MFSVNIGVKMVLIANKLLLVKRSVCPLLVASFLSQKNTLQCRFMSNKSDTYFSSAAKMVNETLESMAYENTDRTNEKQGTDDKEMDSNIDKATNKVKTTMKEGIEAMKDAVGLSSPKKEPVFESSAVGMDRIESIMRDTIPGTDAVGDSEAGAPPTVLESEKEAVKETKEEEVSDEVHRDRTEGSIKGEDGCSQ
jgi:hypothetical protein